MHSREGGSRREGQETSRSPRAEQSFLQRCYTCPPLTPILTHMLYPNISPLMLIKSSLGSKRPKLNHRSESARGSFLSWGGGGGCFKFTSLSLISSQGRNCKVCCFRRTITVDCLTRPKCFLENRSQSVHWGTAVTNWEEGRHQQTMFCTHWRDSCVFLATGTEKCLLAEALKCLT